MISAKEVKVLDKNSEFFGVPTSQLMENAGKGVADFIIDRLNFENKRIVVFCGTGNNGGDGFVAARYLAKTCKVSVFLTGKEIKTDIAKNNFDKLKKLDIKIHTNLDEIDTLLSENDMIIDSMLGIGLSGELKEPYSTIVQKIISAEDKIVVSVDIATGFGTIICVKPDYTVTFHDVKQGMDKDNSGKIHIVDIGIPKDAINYVGPGELSVYYPRPKKQSHKGENGSVLIVGGGPYIGAPALAGLAALRTGADLVFIATPKRSWLPISSFSPNLIVKDLNSDFLTPGDIPTIRELLGRCDAAIIGPGLGSSKETEEAIKKIVEMVIHENKPLVIDADAIKPVGEQPDILKKSNTVITPHGGEFKELTGVDLPQDIDRRIETVRMWAEKLGVAIFLKAPVDILSDGKNTKLNKIHTEAMTVGGTGDVLAGILGALLSKGVEPFNAIRIAAFLNGAAGNNVFTKKSYGLLATDVIEEIPHILKKYL